MDAPPQDEHLLPCLAAWASRMWRALAQRAQRRRDMEELRRLDAAVLRDIGVDAHGAAHFVHYGAAAGRRRRGRRRR